MNTADKQTDNAVYGIIGANVLTLIMAVWQHWSLLGLLWPFWIQSVIIGWYARQRILKLQQFSTEGLTMNDQAVAETAARGTRSRTSFCCTTAPFISAT